MTNVKQYSSVKPISNEKIRQRKNTQPRGGVRELKPYVDKKDKYLIYSIVKNKQFVFKSSKTALNMANNMTLENHYLNQEYCHFDGNPKRVKHFRTLNCFCISSSLEKASNTGDDAM